jgi:hypothetical protein
MMKDNDEGDLPTIIVCRLARSETRQGGKLEKRAMYELHTVALLTTIMHAACVEMFRFLEDELLVVEKASSPSTQVEGNKILETPWNWEYCVDPLISQSIARHPRCNEVIDQGLFLPW